MSVASAKSFPGPAPYASRPSRPPGARACTTRNPGLRSRSGAGGLYHYSTGDRADRVFSRIQHSHLAGASRSLLSTAKKNTRRRATGPRAHTAWPAPSRVALAADWGSAAGWISSERGMPPPL
jgi:hypothetical protein